MLMKEFWRVQVFAVFAALLMLAAACGDDAPDTADDFNAQEQESVLSVQKKKRPLLCKPGDTKMIECNSCKCSEEGLWICTKMYCGDDSDGPSLSDNLDSLAPDNTCKGKVCGEVCSTCTPGPGVYCPAVMEYCNADGECSMAIPFCDDAGDDDEDVNPCDGKVCGEVCSTCDSSDGSPCPAVMEYCNQDGECTMNADIVCEDDDDPVNPCEGKVCGEVCSTCTPGPGVYCPAVMEYCNADGECSMNSQPLCAASSLR